MTAKRMLVILGILTCLMTIPAYADTPDMTDASYGWNQISGNWYYLMGNGEWSTKTIEDEHTSYGFTEDGCLAYARKIPNTGGGAYPVISLDEKEQNLFDRMNEEKKDLFSETNPDAEDSYENGDTEFYDGRAGFVLDQSLSDLAKERLSLAMEHGYQKSKSLIPGYGTITEYVKENLPTKKSGTFFELYLWGPEDTYDPYDSVLLQMQDKYDRKQDKTYSLETYRSLGMAHETKNGKDYYLIVFKR